MRKLSTNMEEVLQCLTDEYTQFGEICTKYGQLQYKFYTHNSNGYVWESLVSRVLNTLIKHKLVEHGKRGEYRKIQPPQTDDEILKCWMDKYVFLSDYIKYDEFSVSVNKKMLIDLIKTARTR